MNYCQYDFENKCAVCGHVAPVSGLVRQCGLSAAWASEKNFQPFMSHGPGTELSKLLKRFGIEPTPTCACRAKAAEMDAWGCDEASRPERIEEVVAVMREEAAARGLPFIDTVGRMLVKRAIYNARKQQHASTG
jgi:hypothetical protein